MANDTSAGTNDVMGVARAKTNDATGSTKEHGAPTPSVPGDVTAEGIRDRARRRMITAITASAHEQIAAHGGDSLSLRAVARDLDMSPSALYRYFASRDDLITALVIGAYNALGEQAERALADAEHAAPIARWLEVCRAVRGWALAHRHEYELIYGTPLAGYQAPQDTVAPASRVGLALVQVVVDTYRSGTWCPCEDATDSGVRRDAERLRTALEVDLPAAALSAVVGAWAELFGLISFELFGQFTNMIDARDEFFEQAARRLGIGVGLPG